MPERAVAPQLQDQNLPVLTTVNLYFDVRFDPWLDLWFERPEGLCNLAKGIIHMCCPGVIKQFR